VCNLLLACRTPDCGPYSAEKLNYFDVKVYGTQAEQASEQMHKGGPVIVEGKLDWREWETVEGHSAQTVSILAETLEFLEDSLGDAHADPVGCVTAGGRSVHSTVF
jgi:single-stranded DNA-binding protein